MTREMRWYEYERNLELEASLIEREKEFWFNNVQSDIAPAPVNAKDILLLYKETNSEPVIANEYIAYLIYGQLQQLSLNRQKNLK